jgi:RND family efflux transporter MFP subunit
MTNRSPFAAILAATALISAACSNTDAAEVDAKTPNANVVTLGARDVAIATLTPITAGIAVTGSLDPADRVEIRAELSGQIERVVVDRGSIVGSDETLAKFDAAIVQARGISALVNLGARERDLDAADTLYRAGVLSERDFTQARVVRDAAKADLAQARDAVSNATVRSPIRGEISEKYVSAGEVVQPGAKLFTVVNNDALELAAQVGADQIGRVRVGQPVRLTLDAYPGRTINGSVARIEPVADAATRRVGVYVRVPNGNHDIVAGLFATGTILTAADVSMPVLAVPTAAVRADSASSASVLAVVGDRVERRTIVVGARDDAAGLLEIRSGLSAGDRVIVAPGSGVAPARSSSWLRNSFPTRHDLPTSRSVSKRR